LLAPSLLSPELVRAQNSFKEAEAAGRSQQKSLDILVDKLQRGHLNPGIGSEPIGKGISEARARDGARVYWRLSPDGKTVEILGKSTKDNQDEVIKLVLEEFGK